MQTVAVVDYGLANIRSVVNAVEFFEAKILVASRGEDLAQADKIILPGVGSFDAGMRGMRARGHADALSEAVREAKKPFLGVCLGMQFLFEGSDEGSEAGLAWMSGRVRGFPAAPGGPKVPHVGWSEVESTGRGRLYGAMPAAFDAYFVHSYYVPIQGEAAVSATGLCRHGLSFVASLETANIFACQFHPEKSQMAGMKIVETFLAL